MNKYCIDCGKKISNYYAKRCHGCAMILRHKIKPRKKHSNPNWKGGLAKCIDCNKTLSNYIAKRCKRCHHKLIQTDSTKCGNYIDGRNHIRCIDCNLEIKKSNKNQTRCWKCYQAVHATTDHYCKECHKLLGRYDKTIYCKKCANKGERSANFGKTILIKCCKYNNIWFKSSWEANFAKWCDLSGIKWEYELKAFLLEINSKKTNYTPDFYLPEFDVWIEIKGYWRKDAQEKFIEFKKRYKQKIYLFNKEKLQEFSIVK